MKIAYYEENDYHTEILGTFLIKFDNCEITVYNTHDKSEWMQYYKNICGFDLKPAEMLIDNYDQYDKIIIGTSTNTKNFLDKLDKNKLLHKLLFVCHLKEDLHICPQSNTIVLTPLNNTNATTYILPINNLYNDIHKKRNNIIGIIGRFKNNNRDSSELVNLIEKYNKYNFSFYLFSRHIKFVPNQLIELQKKYPNRIKIFLKVKTKELIEYFKVIKYLCPLNNDNSIYCKDRLTGIIPLSYNFNIPLIINKKLANVYNIQSGFTYEKSIIEIFENIIAIDDKLYSDKIKYLLREKENIIKKNNEQLINLYNL